MSRKGKKQQMCVGCGRDTWRKVAVCMRCAEEVERFDTIRKELAKEKSFFIG